MCPLKLHRTRDDLANALARAVHLCVGAWQSNAETFNVSDLVHGFPPEGMARGLWDFILRQQGRG